MKFALVPEFKTCQNSSVASVRGWGVDEDNLDYVYQRWLDEYNPTDHEIECVDAFLEHLKANGPVGRRVPGTNIVVDYTEDSKHRDLLFSRIAPPP